MRRKGPIFFGVVILLGAALLGWAPGVGRDDRRSSPAPSSPTGLTATFFGTSTILLDDGVDRILIDGFFSRPPGRRLLIGPISPNEKRIRYALNRARLNWLSAVFVAHSHYDHVMDAPTVASWTDAYLVGSASTGNVAKGENFDKRRLREVRGGARCRFGAFTVRMYSTPHGPTPLPVGQEIEAPLRHPAGLLDYKEGGNFSFLVNHPAANVLIVPSGALKPDTFKGTRADVVFLGVAQLGHGSRRGAEDYWRQAVRYTGARLVIPIHWDNLLRPLSQPLRPVPWPADRLDLAMKWLEEFSSGRRTRRRVELILPRAFDPINLSARPGRPAPVVPGDSASPPDRQCIDPLSSAPPQSRGRLLP